MTRIMDTWLEAGTVAISQVHGHCWDVVVIGAGVAGASTAYWAATLGLKVLLVESKSFPREKVCGGCLNERAQASLERIGIFDDLQKAGAVPLNHLHIQSQRLGVLWRIPFLMSVRRSTLDSRLVQQAINAGCDYLPNTLGMVESLRYFDERHGLHNEDSCSVKVRLKQPRKRGSSVADSTLDFEEEVAIVSRTVVVATGLTRSAIATLTVGASVKSASADATLEQSSVSRSVIEADSRIGVHRLFTMDEWTDCMPLNTRNSLALGGILHMLSGTHGYVGICITDGGVIDVAAAIDPAVVQGKLGIPEVLRQILLECELEVNESFLQTQWQTTPALTRVSPQVAVDRLFLVGDALGYIEPFTGEGMAWGFENAEALAPILRDAVKTGGYSQASKLWEQHVKLQRASRQQVCKWVARQSRKRWKSQWVLRFLDWFPSLRNRILKKAMA